MTAVEGPPLGTTTLTTKGRSAEPASPSTPPMERSTLLREFGKRSEFRSKESKDLRTYMLLF